MSRHLLTTTKSLVGTRPEGGLSWNILLSELNFESRNAWRANEKFYLEAWYDGREYEHSIAFFLTGYHDGTGRLRCGLYQTPEQGGRSIGEFKGPDTFPVTYEPGFPHVYDFGVMRDQRLRVLVDRAYYIEVNAIVTGTAHYTEWAKDNPLPAACTDVVDRLRARIPGAEKTERMEEAKLVWAAHEAKRAELIDQERQRLRAEMQS